LAQAVAVLPSIGEETVSNYRRDIVTLVFFVVFFSALRKPQGQRLKLGQDRFLSHSFQFIISWATGGDV